MRELFQTVMGALGSVGFAVLFDIRGTKLAWAGAGGAHIPPAGAGYA